MALSDNKKVQTMVNVLGGAAEDVRAAVAKMKAVRVKFQTHNPSVAGTPLEGNIAAVNVALNALDAEAVKALWTQLIAAKVPGHSNKALD